MCARSTPRSTFLRAKDKFNNLVPSGSLARLERDAVSHRSDASYRCVSGQATLTTLTRAYFSLGFCVQLLDANHDAIHVLPISTQSSSSALLGGETHVKPVCGFTIFVEITKVDNVSVALELSQDERLFILGETVHGDPVLRLGIAQHLTHGESLTRARFDLLLCVLARSQPRIQGFITRRARRHVLRVRLFDGSSQKSRRVVVASSSSSTSLRTSKQRRSSARHTTNHRRRRRRRSFLQFTSVRRRRAAAAKVPILPATRARRRRAPHRALRSVQPSRPTARRIPQIRRRREQQRREPRRAFHRTGRRVPRRRARASVLRLLRLLRLLLSSVRHRLLSVHPRPVVTPEARTSKRGPATRGPEPPGRRRRRRRGSTEHVRCTRRPPGRSTEDPEGGWRRSRRSRRRAEHRSIDGSLARSLACTLSSIDPSKRPSKRSSVVVCRCPCGSNAITFPFSQKSDIWTHHRTFGHIIGHLDIGRLVPRRLFSETEKRRPPESE